MAQIEAYQLIFLTVLVGHVKSKLCYSSSYDTIYCQYDCCGSSGYQYCCNTYSDSTIYYGPSVGAIVGIVIGCLAGLGLLIGTIVCCCCCHQRRHATNGQVLQPHTNLGFSVMTATATTNGTQMPITQLPPGMYAPSYSTTPQMAGGYMPCVPGNAAMNKPYDAPPSMNNQYGAPPPDYDNVARS